MSTHAEGDEGKGNIFNKIKFVNPLKRRKKLKRKNKRLFTHSKGKRDWKCIKKEKNKINPFKGNVGWRRMKKKKNAYYLKESEVKRGKINCPPIPKRDGIELGGGE